MPTERIDYMKEPYKRDDIIASLHPFVKEWFFTAFKDFSPPQYYSILNIHRRINTLISSPTGSGKTMSAFLAILNELVTLADHGQLENRVYCIYISPLKALGNDIERNLNKPLEEIMAIAQKYGKSFDIRVATRTGDTTEYEKARMLKHTPHILITTPESLSIMLTSTKFAELLKGVQWTVIDEIHSLASSKRGVHLSLSLERLQNEAWFTRIGLSATVAPLEAFASYLVGFEDTGVSRGCTIVDVNYTKQLDLQVISPVKNLIDTPHGVMQDAMFDKIHELVQQHKTTVIFTNTRSATERVVHQLKDRYHSAYVTIEDKVKKQQEKDMAKSLNLPLTPDQLKDQEHAYKSVVAAHHSSLSKEHRLRVESQLKAGELRVVVSSTSLELGIDIGSIDLVILLGSPKSISRALQRIGRAGHRLSDVSKGRIIVLDRDDMVECAVLLKDALERKIDRLEIPQNCLDVLAQTIYGIAIVDQMLRKDMLKIIRRSYCYHTLSEADFDSTIKYLAGEFTALDDRNTYAKIWHDKETDMIGRRGKLARLLFMTNTGTIPDETNVIVKVGEVPIGTIAEPFLERLKRGDVFVLGGDTYEFLFARGMVAQVRQSAGRLPTVPSWYSEMLPLNYDLAREIQKFRKYLSELFAADKTKEEIMAYIKGYVYVDDNACESIYTYFYEQHKFSRIPHLTRFTIEQFKEGSKHYVVFHSLFGRRVNDALSRAIGYTLGKLYHSDIELGITDNGFFLMARHPIIAKRALGLLKADELSKILEAALQNSEVLRRRFRHCAGRSLMILRTYKGQRKSVGKQQVSSQTLLAAVRRLGNDFPIFKEARREVLEDLMDAPHAQEVLAQIENGTITVEETYVDMPSPFSFTIVLQGYSDILKIEDRQLFLQRMHEQVVAKISGKAKPKESIAVQTEAFSYEKHWDNEEKEQTKTEEDNRLILKQQLYRAARKARMEPHLVFEASRLIDGETTGFGDEFIQFLQKLLTGAVPPYFEDELVRFFVEKLPQIQA
jgi:ATP-dependent helicase Lhr and Lhr-like helicase